MHTLDIQNITVEINKKKILKDFSLTINSGEIHAIMGPNGVGKSTLSKTIMGDKNYKIISGEILFDGKNINELETDERARMGLFLGMQMPLEIEGVTNADFLRTALNTKEGTNFKLMPFINKLDKVVEELKMDKGMIHRGINSGFSGGERKKNEVLQMYMLEPSIVILDEIDSGLDVDSLRVVSENVMNYYNSNNPGVLLITHYQRLLDYIKPTHVHILKDGKIIKSGDISLVSIIEKEGYEYFSKNSDSIIEEN